MNIQRMKKSAFVVYVSKLNSGLNLIYTLFLVTYEYSV